MKLENLSDAMDMIDEDMLVKAADIRNKNGAKKNLPRFAAIAACAALVIGVGAYAAPRSNSSINENDEFSIGISQGDSPAMIMVDGKIYKDSGKVLEALICKEPDGEITSYCDNVPTENNQSNFGVGYSYQYGGNNTINVQLDDGWHIFVSNEKDNTADTDISEDDKAKLYPTY